MHFVSTLHFTATEYVNIVTGSPRGDDARQTGLVGTTLRFAEVDFTICNRIKFSFL